MTGKEIFEFVGENVDCEYCYTLLAEMCAKASFVALRIIRKAADIKELHKALEDVLIAARICDYVPYDYCRSPSENIESELCKVVRYMCEVQKTIVYCDYEDHHHIEIFTTGIRWYIEKALNAAFSIGVKPELPEDPDIIKKFAEEYGLSFEYELH